jgi:hypothetical protein
VIYGMMKPVFIFFWLEDSWGNANKTNLMSADALPVEMLVIETNA